MLKSGLANNIMTVLSTRILLKGINFLSLYILLRYLTPAQLGEYGLFISTLVLATTIGNLGVRNSVARAIGKDNSLYLSTKALAIAYPILALLSTAVMVSTLYLSGFTLDNSLKLLVIIAAVLCHLIIILRQGVCLGTGEIKLFNALEVLPRLFLLVMILIVVNGLDGVYQNIAIYGLTLGYLCTAIYALLRTKLDWTLVAKPHVKNLFKTGFAFCLALSLILLNTRIPLYITSVLQDTAEAGQIFAALRINDIFLELATAASLILFSHGTRSNNKDDLVMMLKTIAGIFIATIFIAIATIFFAKDIITWVSDAEYQAAAAYLAIATIGLPFAAFNKMAYGMISGKGKPMIGVYIYCITIPLNIGLALSLYKLNIENYVLYALVISQVFASISFLATLMNKRLTLDNTK